jgi:hypothetical protein
MAHDNARPPIPDAPHGNPLRPWVLPVLAAIIALAIVAWNVDTSGNLRIMPSATTGIAPVTK